MGRPNPSVPGLRRYGPARSEQIRGMVLLLVFGLIAIGGSLEGGLPSVVADAVLAALGLRFVSVMTEQLRLSDDAVELRTIFRRKRLRFDQISGRREYVASGRYGGYRRLKIEPKDDGGPTIKFDKYKNLDSTFYDWFNSLPDLDAAGKAGLAGSSFREPDQ